MNLCEAWVQMLLGNTVRDTVTGEKFRECDGSIVTYNESIGWWAIILTPIMFDGEYEIIDDVEPKWVEVPHDEAMAALEQGVETEAIDAMDSMWRPVRLGCLRSTVYWEVSNAEVTTRLDRRWRIKQ